MFQGYSKDQHNASLLQPNISCTIEGSVELPMNQSSGRDSTHFRLGSLVLAVAPVFFQSHWMIAASLLHGKTVSWDQFARGVLYVEITREKPALHEVACGHNSKNIQHENLKTQQQWKRNLSDPSSGSFSLLSEASKRMLKNHHHHHHQNQTHYITYCHAFQKSS